MASLAEDLFSLSRFACPPQSGTALLLLQDYEPSGLYVLATSKGESGHVKKLTLSGYLSRSDDCTDITPDYIGQVSAVPAAGACHIDKQGMKRDIPTGRWSAFAGNCTVPGPGLGCFAVCECRRTRQAEPGERTRRVPLVDKWTGLAVQPCPLCLLHLRLRAIRPRRVANVLVCLVAVSPGFSSFPSRSSAVRICIRMELSRFAWRWRSRRQANYNAPRPAAICSRSCV